jgi:hypothetical protein
VCLQLSVADRNGYRVFAVTRVKMWRGVLVREHPNDDAEKPTDLRHAVTLRRILGSSVIKGAQEVAFRDGTFRARDGVQELRGDVYVVGPRDGIAVLDARSREHLSIPQGPQHGAVEMCGEISHSFDSIAEPQTQSVLADMSYGDHMKELDIG